MATISSYKTVCFTCKKEKITYPCQGCSQQFCLIDLPKHRQNLSQELDQIENEYDQFQQNLNEQLSDPNSHPLIKEINQWESDEIKKIQQTAEQRRQKCMDYFKEFFLKMEKKFKKVTERMQEMHREDEFNEIDLNHLKEKLQKLQEELQQPMDVPTDQPLITNITRRTLLHAQWKQFAVTVAGGNGRGERIDQVSQPHNFCVEDDGCTIYIADCVNHRIVEWKANTKACRIVAGGNGKGNRTDQLNSPRDVIIDREDNALIIADRDNRRVMRWSRGTASHGRIIISDIDCARLALHEDGSLYVSDYVKNEVRRWKIGEQKSTLVAGGNGKGNQLNQLNTPTSLFVSHDHILYISDYNNHRVMKWIAGANEGIVVASGNEQENRTAKAFYPGGVIVDEFDQIYVANCGSDHVARWSAEAKEGTIVVGGNGKGSEGNQLNSPVGLSLDSQGNLYVADYWNDRIQKFEIE